MMSPNYWGQKALFETFIILKQLTKNHPFSLIIAATKNICPGLKLIYHVVAGKKVYSTAYIPPQNSLHFAFVWLINATKERDHKSVFAKNLSLELMEAFNKRGLAYKTKLEYNITLKDNKQSNNSRKTQKKQKNKRNILSINQKPYIKNSRLKRNAHKKFGLPKIKEKVIPLFHESVRLRYLANKHREYRKNINAVFSRFQINIKQKTKQTRKFALKPKLKKVIKKNIKQRLLIKANYVTFRKNLKNVQKMMQKRYFNLLRKKKYTEKKKTLYTKLREYYYKLKSKLKLNTGKLNKLFCYATKRKWLTKKIKKMNYKRKTAKVKNRTHNLLLMNKYLPKINNVIHKYKLHKYLLLIKRYHNYIKITKKQKKINKYNAKRIIRKKKAKVVPKMNCLRFETKNYLFKKKLLTNQFFFKATKRRQKKIDYKNKTTKLVKRFNQFRKRLKEKKLFYTAQKKLLRLPLIKLIRKYMLFNNKPQSLAEKYNLRNIAKYAKKVDQKRLMFEHLKKKKKKENYRTRKKLKLYKQWLEQKHLVNKDYLSNLAANNETYTGINSINNNSILLSFLLNFETNKKYIESSLAFRLEVALITATYQYKENSTLLFVQKILAENCSANSIYFKNNWRLYNYYLNNEQLTVLYEKINIKNKELAAKYTNKLTQKLILYKKLTKIITNNAVSPRLTKQIQKVLKLKFKLSYFLTHGSNNYRKLKIIKELTNYFNAYNSLYQRIIKINQTFRQSNLLKTIFAKLCYDEISLYSSCMRLLCFFSKVDLVFLITQHFAFTRSMNKNKYEFKPKTVKLVKDIRKNVRKKTQSKILPRNIPDLQIYYTNDRLRKNVKKMFSYNYPAKRDMNIKFKQLYHKFWQRTQKVNDDFKHLYSRGLKRTKRSVIPLKKKKFRKLNKKNNKKGNKHFRRMKAQERLVEEYKQFTKIPNKTYEQKYAQRDLYYDLTTKRQRQLRHKKRLDLKYNYPIFKIKRHAKILYKFINGIKIKIKNIMRLPNKEIIDHKLIWAKKRERLFLRRKQMKKYRNIRCRPKNSGIFDRYINNSWGFMYKQITDNNRFRLNHNGKLKNIFKFSSLLKNEFTTVKETKINLGNKNIVTNVIGKAPRVLVHENVAKIHDIQFYNWILSKKLKHSLNNV